MILVTADLHLSDNPRDDYRHEFVSEHLPKLIDQHEVDQLYILGDLTESKSGHDAVLVNQIVRYLHRLTELCPVTVLRGNHDGTDPDSPFFAFVNRIRRITWVNAPTAAGGWLFLPYTAKFERDWEGIDFKQYRLVFAHNTFHGADAGHGHRLDGIPTEVLKGVPVVSGDVHVPQQLANVTYVGSPYTIDFGDEFEPRVLLVEDAKLIRSVACPGRQKRLIEVPVGVDPVAAMTASSLWTGVKPGDIIKLVQHLSPAQVQHWPNIKADIREWGEQHGYQMHAIVPKRVAEQGVKQPVARRSAKSDAEILAEYGLARGLDETTMKTGRRLLGSA